MAERVRPVGVVGAGAHVPDTVLTNAELERMMDTSDAWIVSRTGIRERRVAAPGVATSDLATEAVRDALRSAGLQPQAVDLLIVATNSPDQPIPATACLVQAAVGARRAAAFDIAAGCSAFVSGVAVGGQFIAAGVYETVVVVGAETMTRIVDMQDRATAVLFGDGAGAVVLRPAFDGTVFHSVLGADGNGAGSIRIPAGGSRAPASFESVEARQHFLQMNGPQVFRFGAEILPAVLEQALREAHLTLHDIALIVPHQANRRIIDAAARRLACPPDKLYLNFDRFGNTSAASVPIAFAEAIAEGKVRKGDRVAFVGFGAGLTWGVNLLTWCGAVRGDPETSRHAT